MCNKAASKPQLPHWLVSFGKSRIPHHPRENQTLLCATKRNASQNHSSLGNRSCDACTSTARSLTTIQLSFVTSCEAETARKERACRYSFCPFINS
jgi:hypothetical protein